MKSTDYNIKEELFFPIKYKVCIDCLPIKTSFSSKDLLPYKEIKEFIIPNQMVYKVNHLIWDYKIFNSL